MKLSEAQAIFSVNAAKLILAIDEAGYACTLGEAWRTPEMAELYAKQGKGIVNSLHRKRLALDLNLFKDGLYLPDSAAHTPFGEYWETLNPMNRWGGRYGDGNHYEMKEK